MSLILLAISVVSLALGPILHRMADAARPTLFALDGFVLVAVSGLAVVHIIPHAFAIVGPLALGLALLGFFGPSMIEHRLQRAAQKAHVATLIFACFGLVADAFVDGVALGVPLGEHGDAHGQGSILAIAVILHRLPIAITVWWLLRPSMGKAVAGVTLVALGIATIFGYAMSEIADTSLHAGWVAYVQALVAGSLLHVVLHRPPPMTAPASHGGHGFAGLGALAGLALVGVLADTHMPLHPEPGAINFVETFMALALESAPLLLLAFALAALVQVYVPGASPGVSPGVSIDGMRSGGHGPGASVRGVAFGLRVPICACKVAPLYRSLVLQGVPATAAMAFLVATPGLGLDAILISWPLLGGELALARLVAALALALLVGLLIGRWAGSQRVAAPAPVELPAVVRGNVWSRVRPGLRYGFGELVDHVGPWFVFGLVVASLVESMISASWLAVLPWGVDVVFFALLGMPTYVCASGATPFAAVLIHKGVSPGAALAFLLVGPALNITTFGVLAETHGRKTALAFAGAILGLAVGMGMLVNELLGDAGALALHEAVEESPGLVSLSCLVALVFLFSLSVLRQGPRAFVGQVLSPYDEDHDDECGHEHGHEEEVAKPGC